MDINAELFGYILKMYPSLIVCNGDGQISDENWNNFMRMAQGLADEYAYEIEGADKERITQIFRTEFRYLLENSERWQKKFLNALRHHIDNNLNEKDFVQETMYLIANATDGLSVHSRKVIADLSKRLNLDH